MKLDIEEGDLVLCTVDRIVGTNVFVKIPYEGREIEGTITFSEIAPGRIRNIRDYVVPKKKMVCKVLRVSGDRVDLTFRRVTQEERKEVKERVKQEKSYEKILEGILGEKGIEIAKKISKEGKIYDFLEEAKENPGRLEKLVGKKDANKIIEIIKSQKKKKTVLKKRVSLTSTGNDGAETIKKLLKGIKEKGMEIKYVSSGEYSITKESENPKKADKELEDTLKKLEEKSKKEGVKFSIIKK